MIDVKYRKAYSEVLEILKYIPQKDFEKIPKEKIELFENNASIDYKFNYNPDKTLEENGTSKIAKGIIAILYRDYWASKEQKQKIIEVQNLERKRIEREKRRQYDPNKIFEYKNESEKAQQSSQDISIDKIDIENLPVLENENIFIRIINIIKSIFYK